MRTQQTHRQPTHTTTQQQYTYDTLGLILPEKSSGGFFAETQHGKEEKPPYFSKTFVVK